MPRRPITCGPFSLERPLGAGGMAEVWRGTHRLQNVPVAVKVITASHSDADTHQQSLRREVQAEARLNHPGIVTVFDYGDTDRAVAEATDGHIRPGMPYIAMELAEIGTLQEDFPVHDWARLRTILFELLDALAYAHARGVIHRDLKPANILVCRDHSGKRSETVTFKLTDFGIAHAITSEMDTEDVFAVAAGTPYYMAPEQFEEEWRDFGPWTDLYALGCVTYQLVCGRPPFLADNAVDIAMMHLDEPPPRLAPNFDIPDGLEGWVRRLMAKRPSARFRRAADAAAALASLPARPTPGSGATSGSTADDTRSSETSHRVATTLPFKTDDISRTLGGPEEPPTTKLEAPRPTTQTGGATEDCSDTDMGPLGAWKVRHSADTDRPRTSTPDPMTTPEIADTAPDPPPDRHGDLVADAPPEVARDEHHEVARTLDPDPNDTAGPLQELPAVGRLTSVGNLGSTRDDAFSASRFQPPPPLPSTWRFDLPAPPDDQLVGAGLSLFGLREVPFIDREAERDATWERLREVFQQKGARAVMLRGATGAGKSRLARWICRRAHEVGAVTVLRGAHEARTGPANGIPRILESHFALWRLDRTRTYRRIRRRLNDAPGARSAGEDPELLENDARALTELVRPSGDSPLDSEGPGYRFASADERYATVARQLRRVGRERPLAVWLDDVQWGADSLALVEHVLAQDPDLPAMFVLTVDDDTLEADSRAAGKLDELAARESVIELEIDTLPAEHHRELVNRLLPLESSLVDRVQDRTAGHPLFAVQLVGDWVERGVLEVGEAGFRLKDGEQAPLPDHIHGLWERRLAFLLETFDGSERGRARRALIIAAALGQEIDRREWQVACRNAGIQAPDGLAEAMIDRGLATPLEHGWSFAHGMLRESLERSARERDWWHDSHYVCAGMLRELYDPQALGVAERLANHLLAAEERAEALEPLLWAASGRKEIGELTEALELLDRRAELMDALGLSDVHRQRAQGLVARAGILKGLGRPDQAAAAVDRALEFSRDHDWPDILADLYRIRGNSSLYSGDFDETIEYLETARRYARRADDPLEMGSTLFYMGHVHRERGQLEQALNLLEQAAARFRQAGADGRRATVFEKIAYVHLQADRIDRAEYYLSEAMNLLEDAEVRNPIAMASTLNTRGDAARLAGAPARAVDYYERAGAIFEHCNMTGYRYTIDLNIGLTHLEMSDWEAAADILETSAEHLRELGATPKWIISQAGLSVCDATVRDWNSWDSRFREVAEFVDQQEFTSRDIALAAAQSAAVAAAHGQTGRARRAWRLARGQWEALGDAERVSQIDKKLAQTDDSPDV